MCYANIKIQMHLSGHVPLFLGTLTNDAGRSALIRKRIKFTMTTKKQIHTTMNGLIYLVKQKLCRIQQLACLVQKMNRYQQLFLHSSTHKFCII